MGPAATRIFNALERAPRPQPCPIDWLRLIRTSCALEARDAAELYREAMSKPEPPPRVAFPER